MENINLIRKIAWSFFNKTGFDYEELFAEASLAYCKALESYDEDKNTKLTTYAYQLMKNRLKNFIKKEYNYIGKKTSMTESKFSNFDEEDSTLEDWSVPDNTMESGIDFNFAMNKLSSDAKEVFEMIKGKPHEYLCKPSKNARGDIYRELREHGWSWSRIWDTFSEIKNCLNEIG